MGAPSDNDPNRNAAQLDEAPVDDGWTTGSPVHNDRTTAGLYVDPASVGRLTAGLGKNPFAPSPEPTDRPSADLDADGLARGSNHDRITTKPAVDADSDRITAEPADDADSDRLTAEAADDHDPTTAALDALSVDADNDRTTVEPPPVRTIDSTVAALDRTMAELEGDAVAASEGGAIVEHDRTKSGLAVATPAVRPRFSLLQPGRGTVPLEKEHALVQPERSPLDFVMRDMDPASPQQPHTSGDSSRFVASFMGDQPRPAQVDAEAPVITAMEPVLRRARKRRQLIAACAAALVVAVLGTAVAMKMGGADESPRTAASEAANVGESAAPAAASATNVATPSAAATQETPAAGPANNVATPTASNPHEVAAAHDPSSEPTVPAQATAPPAQPETVALATTTEVGARSGNVPSVKPAIAKTVATKDSAEKKPAASKDATAKKTVATKDATPKKSSTAKSTTEKKTIEKKSTTAKKSVATSTTTKKSSAKPATTAKKSTAKKVSTAKAPSSAKKPATKSSSSTKKPTTKKPATTKKTATKKTTRS